MDYLKRIKKTIQEKYYFYKFEKQFKTKRFKNNFTRPAKIKYSSNKTNLWYGFKSSFCKPKRIEFQYKNQYNHTLFCYTPFSFFKPRFRIATNDVSAWFLLIKTIPNSCDFGLDFYDYNGFIQNIAGDWQSVQIYKHFNKYILKFYGGEIKSSKIYNHKIIFYDSPKEVIFKLGKIFLNKISNLNLTSRAVHLKEVLKKTLKKFLTFLYTKVKYLWLKLKKVAKIIFSKIKNLLQKLLKKIKLH